MLALEREWAFSDHCVLVLGYGSFLGHHMVTVGYGRYSNLHNPATTWQFWDTGRCAKLHTCVDTAQVQTCASTVRGVVLVHGRHMNMCACTTRLHYWDMAYMIKDPCATVLWHWLMADT